MKKIYSLISSSVSKYILLFNGIVLLSAGMLVTSCLDQDVNGVATDENYYETRYQMQTALNAAFDVLQSDDYWDQEWRFGEGMSDNVVCRDESLSTDAGQLVMFRFTTSNTWILSRWQVNYKGIHRANQVIANMDRVEITNDQVTTFSAVRYIYAQAKFLRAFYYFNLVKSFGGVPIRPEVEDVNGLVVPRSSKDECYAYIEKDLREAAIMLPTAYQDRIDLGKITVGACVALLMKVLMYESTPGVESESWEKMKRMGDYMVGGATMTMGEMIEWEGTDDEWEELRCKLWFKPKSMMTESELSNYDTPESTLQGLSQTYSLEYKDYDNKDLNGGDKWAYIYQWYSEGEYCKGSVWEVVFKESADGTTGDTNEGSGLNFFFEDTYVMYGLAAIQEDIFGTDIRNQYFLHHQEVGPDGYAWQGGEGRYLSLKWYTPKADMPLFDGDTGQNRRMIRYVEVKLMYAEALNECGDREGALTQLNDCKAQVNTINSSTQLYTAGSYATIRDEIYDERRKELCFEFDRYYDLVRSNRAATAMHTYGTTGSGATNRRGLFWTVGKHELLPIPQTEIDVSNGVVEQNPGY